jgi:hypothetical protein
MPSPIRPSLAAPLVTHSDSMEARSVSADTSSDTHEALLQMPSSATAIESQDTLQAPTGTLQMALQTTSGRDGMLSVPLWPQPALTRASLEAWQDAAGLRHAEYIERRALATEILRLAAPSARAGSNSDRLKIEGSLILREKQHLTQLPAGLSVRGDLDCSGCLKLTQLPYGLTVSGNLSCYDCPKLTQLPEGLSVGGSLDCGNCIALTHMPAELSIGGDFSCNDCISLTQLPVRLSIGGNFSCGGCTSLTQLPEKLSVGGELYCNRCTSLIRLSEELSVGGDLDCSDCTSLTQLPESLSVGGDLNCSGCISLTQLPERPSVSGDLICCGCTGLTSLPNSISSWGALANGNTRFIDLSGSGISPALRQRLEQVDLPGMRFHFSNAPAASADVRFADLNTAATFWSKQAQRQIVPDLAAWTDVSVRDCDLLRQFLGRLCDTADYQQPNARLRLAGRVCDLLQAMDESPALRRLGSDRISDALQTCDDRVIWTMNQLEIAVRVNQAQNSQDGASLQELVLSFMSLDIVQDHARQKVNSLTWVDEVEVFLAYESGLREALKLPVSAEHMLHASCAKVTQADLDRAQDAAEAAVKDPVKVAAYLDVSPTWQHYLRRQQAKQWAWERMVPEALPQGLQADEMQCPITLENFAQLAQPVLAPSGSTWRAYEAEALLTHWVEHGTDAYHHKLKLADLRRLPKWTEDRPAKRQRTS